mgnify:CR=1 FL=1
MAERTRPIRIEFRVTEQERRLIQNKMAQLGTRNMGAYLRKMAIDGYIIKVDYTQQKKLAAAVSRAASNINQICRRINSTGHLEACVPIQFNGENFRKGNAVENVKRAAKILNQTN